MLTKQKPQQSQLFPTTPQEVSGAGGNTPPQNTSYVAVDRLRSVLIDWLDFTIKFPEDFLMEFDYRNTEAYMQNYAQEIARNLGLTGKFEIQKFAFYGYSRMLQHDETNVKIMYNPTQLQMGIHFSASGQEVNRLFSVVDVKHFLNAALRLDAEFSRIDFSVDIKVPAELAGKLSDDEQIIAAMSPEFVHQAIRAGRVLSQWRSVERNIGESLKGERTKDVLYLGRIDSNCAMRIYDKKLERAIGGNLEQIENLLIWNRWEMVFRHNNATRLVQLLAELNYNFGEAFFSVLSAYLSIKDTDGNDSNRSRCPNAHEWEVFTNYLAALPLGIHKPEPKIERALRWFLHSCAAIEMGLLQDSRTREDLLTEQRRRREEKDFKTWGQV